MTWNRPPTEAEFQGLVEEYLKEEVLYREALGMGRPGQRVPFELAAITLAQVREQGDEANPLLRVADREGRPAHHRLRGH